MFPTSVLRSPRDNPLPDVIWLYGTHINNPCHVWEICHTYKWVMNEKSLCTCEKNRHYKSVGVIFSRPGVIGQNTLLQPHWALLLLAKHVRARCCVNVSHQNMLYYVCYVAWEHVLLYVEYASAVVWGGQRLEGVGTRSLCSNMYPLSQGHYLVIHLRSLTYYICTDVRSLPSYTCTDLRSLPRYVCTDLRPLFSKFGTIGLYMHWIRGSVGPRSLSLYVHTYTHVYVLGTNLRETRR